MTTTSQEDAALGAALARLWQRHRQATLDLITLLEMTTADVLRSKIDHEAVADAAGAAHKLAGSLGTFGFESGSRAALEAELLLREPRVDGERLAESVTALRTSVDGVGDDNGRAHRLRQGAVDHRCGRTARSGRTARRRWTGQCRRMGRVGESGIGRPQRGPPPPARVPGR